MYLGSIYYVPLNIPVKKKEETDSVVEWKKHRIASQKFWGSPWLLCELGWQVPESRWASASLLTKQKD